MATKLRRQRLDLNEQAELAIYNAMQEVEKIGADVRLTNAVIKLSEAKDLVADFIDEAKVYTLILEKNTPTLSKDGAIIEVSKALKEKFLFEEKRFDYNLGVDCSKQDIIRGRDFRLLNGVAYDMDEV
jgi:hypothetical protein